ncbi:AAA family ATPase [Romeriopsis navalis]|uniref:AAA family ATPase n=1 Tax=Romeriopsis navalis TaxID=2992132 RepID=UPI0021F8B1D8|nr:AAA family ATPase [Romeriopsis navalis]
MELDLPQIEARKQTLEAARVELKQHFVGIDDIIDDLLDYIQIWYLMPEILSRPIIINLWGMTGVGKTDLVRRLVKCLNFQDRFTEIELSNVDSTAWQTSVSEILESNNINDGESAIVLFDEIQRFNTLNPDGSPIQTTKFADFWELLSDGKLSKREKVDLDHYLQDYLFQQREQKRQRDRGQATGEEESHLGLYEAQQLKDMLKLDHDILDIADMSRWQMIEKLQQAKRKKQIYEPIDHAKTLVIISGNLDEAFSMATQTSESDIDADIFHAFTQKITLVDVKNALSRKFRPEQVARFGNIHLIYKSLKKTDFERLIEQEIQSIADKTQDKFGVVIHIDHSIHQLIYRNGVFPVQGVRPVFSSVVDILETNLSKFLFAALLNHQKTIDITYDFTTAEVVAIIGSMTQRLPFTGQVDKIRQSNLQDTVTNISVHESGHALAYMVLFGLAPLQLKSKLADSYAAGFTFPHQIHETRDTLVHKIKIYLAGGLAEELVFGAGLASIGRGHDRQQVTTLAAEYVRRYGFDPKYQANYAMDEAYELNKFTTDRTIEKMIARLVKETVELLKQYQPLLHDLSWQLAATGSLEASQAAAIALKHNLTVQVREEGFLHIPNYHQILQEGLSLPDTEQG